MTNRQLLSETKSAKSFLLEFDSKTKTMLERAKKNPDIPIYMNGPIQRGDEPNKNERIYPMAILWKECLRYMAEEVKNGQSFGELDHPDDAMTARLQFASHTVEDIWRNPKDKSDKTIYGRIMLLNSFTGPGDPAYKARSIVLNNKVLGISSRALASVEEATREGEYDIVQEDLSMVCWDLVSAASTHNANMAITEQFAHSKRNNRNQFESFDKSIADIIGIQEYLSTLKKK